LESKSSRDLRRKGAISLHNTGFAALNQAFQRRETRKQKPKDEKQKERKPIEQQQGNRVDCPTAQDRPKKLGSFGERRFLFVFKYKVSGLKFYFQGGGENIFSGCVPSAS
jgi:hypothetical protein